MANTTKAPATTCTRSWRVVSAQNLKRAIYTDRWLAFCPGCERAVPFSLAEIRKDGAGYVRRYLEH